MPEQSQPTRAVVFDWLRMYNGNDEFLRSLQSYLSRRNTLTDRQYDRAVENYRRLVLGEAAGGAIVQPALFSDVTHIHNGVYTVHHSGEHMTFQVYTPQRGALQGKRIIKRMQGYNNFNGFAFLSAEGTVKVWRRFAEDDRMGATYVEWAKVLINFLDVLGRDRTHVFTSFAAGEETWTFATMEGAENWTVSRAAVCRRCNRRLTTPTSIRAGIGPECQSRGFEETTPVDQQRAVHTAATEMNYAAQQAQMRLQRAQERPSRLPGPAQPALPMSELGTGEVQ